MRKLAIRGLIPFSIIATLFFGLAALAQAAPANVSGPAGSGPLVDLQRGIDDPTDGATAQVVSTTSDGSTTVDLDIAGLDTSAAGTVLGAHLHVGSCQLGDGAAAGPHFNASTADPKVVSNQTEVWLDFTIGLDGTAHSSTTVPFVIPNGAAKSLVVHAMSTSPTGAAGARLACLRVTTSSIAVPAGSGLLVDLQPTSNDPTDGATAQVVASSSNNTTTVVLDVEGLAAADAGMTFGAHLHVGACAAGDGAAAGPHYNITTSDPKVVNNQTEIWLDFTILADGSAHSSTTVPFLIPEGATQSLVIHAEPTNATGGAGARLACLSLVSETPVAPITPPSTGSAGLAADRSASGPGAFLALVGVLALGAFYLSTSTRASE